MALNLFGPPTKDDIKVAYIDPILGLVEGVSICEANEYAKREPGTTFIFRNGNQTLQYLNVNEINQLDPNVLITTDECGGISQKKECGPPTIQIFGGGGIGAAGNPIVGNDGAILAVDIVRGGNGYQYPPLVSARDICNYGSGASFTTVIGEVVETTETFNNEADFEDYELCEPTDVGYGRRYGPDGEDLGSWDPKVYTEPGEDPIRKEVEEFERIVRRLARAPFWTTRKNKPTKITCSDARVIPSEYSVTFPAWNEFMNSYAISPVSPSNTRGSDFAGRLFTYEWTEDFPVDGEYIFRGLCDNKAQLYVDNLKVTDLGSFRDPVKSIQKTFTKGLHNIRVDLLNVPIIETVTRQPVSQETNIIDVDFNVRGDGNAAFTHNFKVSGLGIDVFKPRKTPLNQNVTGKAESGKVYEVEFFVNGSPGGSIRIKNNGLRIEMEDGGGKNPVDAAVNISQGKFTNVRGNKCSFVVGEPRPPASVPTQTNTSNPTLQVKKVFNTVDFIGRANRTLWRVNPTASSGDSLIAQYGVSPFDTTTQEAQTNSFAGVHTIVWSSVNFPVDGSYRIKMAVDDNVRLFIGEEEIRYNGFVSASKANRDFNESRTFKAGNYTLRAELEQINGKPLAKGNPMALAIDIETTTTTETIVSPKSWNENPMGISVTIDAPEPSVPKEPIPEQEGRCPNNPIWTTRFPGAKETWFPVKFNTPNTWSKFMNRYAISPVRPLDTPGSDISGSTFTNSWDIDIPYDGFYGVRGTRDNTGRILIDETEVSKLNGFSRENPDITKVFITKGRHTISVEVFNQPIITETSVSQKIFRTKDWQVEAKNLTQNADVDFNVRAQGDFASTFKIQDLGINLTKPFKTSNSQVFSNKVEVGKVYNIEIEVPQSSAGVRLEIRGKTLEMEEAASSSSRDIFCTISRGRFFDVKNGAKKATCKFVVDDSQPVLIGLTGGTSRDGVTYEGPPLFAYKDNRWGEFMNNHSVSPVIPGNVASERMRSTWKGVRFPESGQYDIRFLSDSGGILFIGGKEVLRAQQFAENPQTFKVNITQGTYDVVVDNDYPYFSQGPNTIEYFRDVNPTGFALVIRKNVTLRNTQSTPWSQNPVGISAVLIPPPCPRRIRGKGIVTDVIVNDPGNGYLPPIAPTTTPPSTLALIQTNVPGVPGGGAGAGAGGGTGVPGAPGGAVPLSIPSPPSGAPTGINASFRPQFEVVRDPVVIDPQKLLQVTDLVGLKQTGYVNGRAYYGAVYYDKGIRYAGFYETIGEPIQVYDTLRESILAQVITPPSAILRQGTDTRSNNPLLNIPGTIQSTLSSNSIVGAGDISTPSVPFVPEPVQDPIYPVSLRLKRVLVEDPGINYNVTDQIRIIPSNGAVLEPVFGSFGRIIKVAVIDPGFGFTEYPRIEMFTPL